MHQGGAKLNPLEGFIMRLPETLQQRPFREWNSLTKGIVEIWEVAQSFGWEENLEEHLSRDDEGHLSELLGRLGDERLRLKGLMERISLNGRNVHVIFLDANDSPFPSASETSHHVAPNGSHPNGVNPQKAQRLR
jgi:hypothetical protein